MRKFEIFRIFENLEKLKVVEQTIRNVLQLMPKKWNFLNLIIIAIN